MVMLPFITATDRQGDRLRIRSLIVIVARDLESFSHTAVTKLELNDEKRGKQILKKDKDLWPSSIAVRETRLKMVTETIKRDGERLLRP